MTINFSTPTLVASLLKKTKYIPEFRLETSIDLEDTFKEGFSYRLERKFDYSDKSLKVKENKGLFIIRYNEDLTLTRLK